MPRGPASATCLPSWRRRRGRSTRSPPPSSPPGPPGSPPRTRPRTCPGCRPWSPWPAPSSEVQGGAGPRTGPPPSREGLGGGGRAPGSGPPPLAGGVGGRGTGQPIRPHPTPGNPHPATAISWGPRIRPWRATSPARGEGPRFRPWRATSPARGEGPELPCCRSGLERGLHPVGGERELADALAGGVEDRVADRAANDGDGRLAGAQRGQVRVVDQLDPDVVRQLRERDDRIGRPVDAEDARPVELHLLLQ